MKWPSVSFIICTYNCRDNAKRCFESIQKQDYPKNKIEILALDGGSTDGTIKIAQKMGVKVIFNPTQYPEGKGRGKWLGYKKAKKEIMIFLDSDNALVEKDWIKKMVTPLIKDKTINFCICRMAVMKKDKLINRYLSLIGTDPFVSYCSIDSLLSLRKLKLKNNRQYYTYKITLKSFIITGGYYFVIKKKTLDKIGGYTQDTDVVYNLAKKNMANVAIPKKAHVYHLISKSIIDFTKKKVWWAEVYFQKQRVGRDFDYDFNRNKIKIISTILKNLLFIPETIVGIKMSIKDKETAWLLHPIMSWLTTAAYSYAFIKTKLT